jgi:hypothetical protein
MSLYEISEDGIEVSVANSGIPGSKKLSIYEVIVEDTATKTIIDSVCIIIFIGEETAKEAGLKVKVITPRRIRIADKEISIAIGIVIFQMKLGNLPVEIIMAYTFPLSRIGLILGLPWLVRHNPHMDFRTMSYEFTRNGRRYQLHPPQ